MEIIRAGLIAFLFGVGTQVQALSCTPIGEFLPIPVADPPLSSEEIARLRSIGLKEVLENRGPNDVIVYGMFSRKTDVPFYHEEIAKDLRAMYWPQNFDFELPYSTTFSYPGIYRFDGNIVNEGLLEPFQTDRLVLEITLWAEYQGMLDAMPPEDVELVGVLYEAEFLSTWFKIETSACGGYYSIEPEEMDYLLECLSDPECK